MPFCANCGSDVQGRFCAKCGTPMAGPIPNPAQPPGPSPYVAPSAPYVAPAAAQAGLDENLACALCYLLGILTGVLFLVLEPYNKNRNIRFHAFQAIFVWLAMFVGSIVFAVVAGILRLIPFIGWTVSLLLWPIFGLGCLALWLMLMYKAYNNQRWVLPVIGPLAEKQA
jgi:uncharacterized membrane protein